MTPRSPRQNLKLSSQQPSFPQTLVFDHIVSLKSKHQEEQNKWFQNILFPVVDLDRQRHSGMPTKSLEGIKTTKYQCCTQQIHTKPKSCELCWNLNTSPGLITEHQGSEQRYSLRDAKYSPAMIYHTGIAAIKVKLKPQCCQHCTEPAKTFPKKGQLGSSIKCQSG